jgi:hypothetical protein
MNKKLVIALHHSIGLEHRSPAPLKIVFFTPSVELDIPSQSFYEVGSEKYACRQLSERPKQVFLTTIPAQLLPASDLEGDLWLK